MKCPAESRIPASLMAYWIDLDSPALNQEMPPMQTMQTNMTPGLHADARLTALFIVVACLLTGCGSGTDDAPNSSSPASVPSPTSKHEAVAVAVANNTAQSSQASVNEAHSEPADFEGTMQQVRITLGPDAISAVAGSNDLSAILALSPDRVIKAVHNGEVEAKTIRKSTLEIDGRMARLQTEGESGYTIYDGEQVAAHIVDPDNKMIMTMDGARMAAARAESGDSIQIDAKQIGESSIRGYDAIGYRFDLFGDNIATVWLSEDFESDVGPIFDIMAAVNLFGPMEVGEGAPVRSVMVNRETLAKGRGFMPAYTITEFYDLQPGAVADDRFDLPEGYQRQSMADLRNAAAAGSGQ